MPEVHKIVGPPGTGKTTYLINIVEQELANGVLPGEIIYTSFTKAAALEARDRALVRFPKYVKSDFPWFSTIHSICFRLLGLSRTDVFSGKQVKEFCAAYDYKLSSENQALSEDVDSDMPHMVLSTTADYYEHFISWMRNIRLPYSFALQRFCAQPGLPNDFNTADLKIYIDRRNKYKEEKRLFDFTDMIELTLSNGLCPVGARILITDEQQDASPLLAHLLEEWGNKMERVYMGGDPYQAVYCLPCDTKITQPFNAKNIEDMSIGSAVICAIGSGRSQSGPVINTSSRIYDGNLVKLTTQSGKELRVTPEHTMFWNWKWSWLDDKKNDGLGWWYVYLMKMGDRWRIGKTDNPAVRLRFEHGAEGILPITAYKTEEEALTWEEIYSLKYGIPTTVFCHRGVHGLNSISQEAQDKIFANIDSFDGAGRLMVDLNKPWIGYIRPMGQTTAYSGIQRQYIHLLALHHDHTNFRRYIYWDFGVVSPRLGMSGSKYILDLQECRQFADKKAQELDADVFEKWPFTDAHMYQPVPASNLLPGCYVPVWNGDKIIDDMVTSVSMVRYFGPVFDLQIGLYNNFIANGIFVHNCFMGADPSVLIKAKADKSIVLKQSYRCSAPIHDISRKLVERFNTRYTDDDLLPTKQQGIVTHQTAEGIDWPSLKGRIFYLHRTNWLLSQAYEKLIEEGVPFGTTKGYLAQCSQVRPGPLTT